MSRLAKYGPPNEDGVCEPNYRLRERGENPTPADLAQDGDTFQVMEEGKPPRTVFIPGCIFAPREPTQHILYPGV